MIQFNELRIVDGKLIIDASVKDLTYFQEVTIAELHIDNQDTFSIGGPSTGSSSYHLTDFPEGTLSEDEKHLHIELTQLADFTGTKLKLDTDLLFVYIVAGGVPAENTPCGMDNCYSTGAVTNLTRIYNKGIGYIKELANSCTIPTGFADFILKYKAFLLSIRTCDYLQAIKFWRKFFSSDSRVITKGCGCHGGYNS